MNRGAAIVALAGAASTALFLVLLRGGAGGSMLAYFVQLPLMFCALTIGLGGAAVASFGAVLATTALAGMVAGGMFLGISAGPAMIVARHALRRLAPQEGGAWYPIGRLLAEIGIYCFVVTTGLLILTEFYTGDLAAVLTTAGELIAAQLPAAALPEAIRSSLAAWALWLPGIVAGTWFLMCIANGLLGQWLGTRSGLARRPSPDITELVLPWWCAVAFGAGILLALLPLATATAIGATAIITMGLVLSFQGLAVVHVFLRGRSAGKLVFFAFYATILIFSWPLVLVLVALGLIDDVVRLRGQPA